MSDTAAGVVRGDPGAAGAAVVRARALRVARGPNPVVRGVDLLVRPGETVAVLGPNGAGKSTLLEAVGGLHPVSGGQLERTGRVATVLQTPGLARRSVRANVELALAWWGVPRRDRRPRAVEALQRMGADHLARRPATALSGGERRRVHVARGLALRPDLLLLDEPFAGLDPQTRSALCDDTGLALRATADAGGAVVVVLHERAEAWALADRIVVMLDGRIAADDEPRALLERPPSAAVARFLGYDGELRSRDHVLLTRPNHVRLDVHGEHEGVVRHIVRREDDLRLTVDTEAGWVVVTRAWGDVVVGDDVRFRVEGGARFPREG